QTERAVAVVGEDPVLTRMQLQTCSHQHSLVPGSADLEKGLLLVLEQDLLVVHLPRQEHQSVGCEQLVARQPFVFSAARRAPLGAARRAGLGATCLGSLGARLRAVGQAGTLHRSQIIAPALLPANRCEWG